MDYTNLWQFVQGLTPGAALTPAEVQIALAPFADRLVHLLKFKGPSDEARRQLQSGRVVTQLYGEVLLDPEPDQKLALLLSQDLRLDEVYCVELLTAAQELGVYTAEAALGVYLRERLAAAQSLARLLSLQLLNGALLPDDGGDDGGGGGGGGGGAPPLLAAVAAFNSELLAATEAAPGGPPGAMRNALIGSILDDTSLDAPGAALPLALDPHTNAQTPRAAMLQLERAALARALLYAVLLTPPGGLEPAAATQLVKLAGAAAARARAAGAAAPHALQQQEYLVTLAAAAALAPPPRGGGGGLGGGDGGAAGARRLVQDPDLAAAIAPAAGGAPAQGGPHAVLLLAWALLKDAAASPGSPLAPPGPASPGPAAPAPRAGGGAGGAQALLEEAGRGGALGALASILRSTAFKLDGEPDHRGVCAEVAYRLVGQLLMFDAGTHQEVMRRLIKASDEAARAAGGAALPAAPPLAPPGGGGGGALALVPAGGGGAGGAAAAAAPDDMVALLRCLAAVFAAAPSLWFDELGGERHQLVSGLMSHLAVHRAMQLPDVRASFLSVMTSLASGGPVGARLMLAQFAASAARPELEHLTWRTLFRTLVGYCGRYQQIEAEKAAAGAAGSGLMVAPVSVEDKLMHPGEEKLLVAYLQLLATIIREGEESEVRAALGGIERECGPALQGLPLHEPLFQLMSHGVPTAVKAAIDEVLCAMARFRDLSVRLLERLLQAQVVTPSIAEGYPGAPRFDMLVQMTEVEARQEEYGETIAFLGLINALLGGIERGPAGLQAAAGATAHYTAFTLEHIMPHLWQRGYKDPKQRWQLAAACLVHCALALEALPAPLPPGALLGRPPPGAAVVESALAGGAVFQSIMHMLQPGEEALEAAMDAGDEGPDREAATLAALRLLNALLSRDAEAAAALNAAAGAPRYAPLERLLADHQRLAALLMFVRYPVAALQTEAIRLAAALSGRLPNLVDLLQPDFDEAPGLALRHAYAEALAGAAREALEEAEDAAAAGAPGPEEAAADDPAAAGRADLILDLLLTNLESGALPGLAHLLLGFDAAAPPADWRERALLPRGEFSCLTDVHRLPAQRPGLYAKALHLALALASDPATAEPVMRLLLPGEPADGLLPLLGQLLRQPLPPPAGGGAAGGGVHAAVSALRQRAYVLRWYALALFSCRRRDARAPLLAALFGDAPGGGGGAPAGGAAAGAAAIVLSEVVGVAVAEPSIKDLPPEELRVAEEMVVADVSVRALLTGPQVIEQLGLVTTDATGQPVFDFPALAAALHERWEGYVSRNGGRGGAAEAAATAAVRAALRYAQQVNAYALVTGAQYAALSAWRQAVEVALTSAYPLLEAVAPGRGPEVLRASLVGALGALQELSGRQSTRLTEALAGAPRVLLSKLRELASLGLGAGLPSDPLAQVRLPGRCLEVLRMLLDALGRASGPAARPLRCELYAALLQYLHFCRGSKLGDTPPLVLERLLEGLGPGVTAGQLDVLQLDVLQGELERGNAAELRARRGPLVALLSQDALAPAARGGMGQAVALHLLSALVAADAGGAAVAAEAHAKGVPRALLDGLARYGAGAAVYVVEAQLSLLLRLAGAGGPGGRMGSAKALQDAGAIPYLCRCDALDLVPEEPSSIQRSGARATSLRYRLVHIVAPALRLVLALVAAHPDSEKVRSQAAEFAEAHPDLLARLMTEAAAPGSMAWAPGDEELEQASLAVQLVAGLPQLLSRAGALRRPLLALWPALCGDDARSASPLVGRVRRGKEELLEGPARREHEERQHQLLALRCGLARQLRALVAPAGAGGGGEGGGELLRCVGLHSQAGVDAQGRPTLMLIRDTADQAARDAGAALEDLEDILSFLSTPDGGLSESAVSQKLNDWGPFGGGGGEDGGGGGGGAAGGLEPAAARRLARQACARGGGALLRRLAALLHLLEQCLAIVLLHFLQCLPRPDRSLSDGADRGAGADAMAVDALGGGGGGADGGPPGPGPADAERLGSELDLQYLGGKLRDVCIAVDELGPQVRAALCGGGGELAGGGGGGGGAFGGALDSLELLNRQIKAYLAAL
ncbi:MAG: hypothetical protein J3K34DRAFT_524227 [Monoraphidium minutum]|nr:MAG: hypothetical protein J3K34DRAFT_524227 [Monoraphidium minutum]